MDREWGSEKIEKGMDNEDKMERMSDSLGEIMEKGRCHLLGGMGEGKVPLLLVEIIGDDEDKEAHGGSLGGKTPVEKRRREYRASEKENGELPSGSSKKKERETEEIEGRK